MDKPAPRSVFVCQQCGRESLKWLGRCPNCMAFNTLEERAATEARSSRAADRPLRYAELSEVSLQTAERFPVPMGELNRVLGGGIVPGSLVLIGGEPGIGKSTLLLQLGAQVAGPRLKVVYASGEETANQIKLRANRLGISGNGLFLLAETDMSLVLGQLEGMAPGLLIVDSIQTAHTPEDDSPPGSVTQVRECAQGLMRWAKASGVPVFITGHVTKEGAIAGPRLLEHIVDVVLYLEGEQVSAYRLLRSVKNRFGSTNEVGVFEMKENGLVEVENPSRVFMSQREGEAIGAAVAPIIEGSRPLLVEVQALTNPTVFGTPRRTANGVDFNRLLMIVAVLGKRLGMRLGAQDVMINVTGGLRIDEPAADLAVALALASSYRDIPVAPDLAAVGEIGLAGELRAVPQVERRVAEAARLGFKRIIVPASPASPAPVPGITAVPLRTVREAVEKGLVASGNRQPPARSRPSNPE